MHGSVPEAGKGGQDLVVETVDQGPEVEIEIRVGDLPAEKDSGISVQ